MCLELKHQSKARCLSKIDAGQTGGSTFPSSTPIYIRINIRATITLHHYAMTSNGSAHNIAPLRHDLQWQRPTNCASPDICPGKIGFAMS